MKKTSGETPKKKKKNYATQAMKTSILGKQMPRAFDIVQKYQEESVPFVVASTEYIW